MPHQPQHNPDNPAHDASRGPHAGLSPPPRPTLADLSGDLLWPRLLRAGHIALSPTRLGLALFTVLILGLLGTLPAGWSDGPGPLIVMTDHKLDALGTIAAGAMTLQLDLTLEGLRALFFGTFGVLFHEYPVSGPILLPLLLVVIAVGGGAISRSAVCEASQGLHVSWTRALGFALARWSGLLTALAAPIVALGLLFLLIALGGLLLLSLPVIEVLGALLFPLALLAALAMMFIVIAFFLGGPLLLPALATEGTDGTDAIQRAFAYTLGRPLRLLVYYAVAFAIGILAVGLVWLVLTGTIAIAAETAGLWAGDRARDVIAGQTDDYGWSAGLAAWLIDLWIAIPLLLATAYLVSFYFTASSISYLLIRCLHDHQDPGEIWMPGMVEGTMAQSLHARAERIRIRPNDRRGRRNRADSTGTESSPDAEGKADAENGSDDKDRSSPSKDA